MKKIPINLINDQYWNSEEYLRDYVRNKIAWLKFKKECELESVRNPVVPGTLGRVHPGILGRYKCVKNGLFYNGFAMSPDVWEVI